MTEFIVNVPYQYTYDSDSKTYTVQSNKHPGAIFQADTLVEAIQGVQEILDDWQNIGLI